MINAVNMDVLANGRFIADTSRKEASDAGSVD